MPAADALALISQRWPAVAEALARAPEIAVERVEDGPRPTLRVEGLHLSSRYDPDAEAAVQALLIPSEAEAAWVYGVGVGALPRLLLHRPRLKILHLVVLNVAVFRQVLRHFHCDDWLADPRLELHLGSDVAKLQGPFCAVPPCLKLAEEGSSRLRDNVVLTLDSSYLNQRFQNNAAIRQQIEANGERLAGDRDVAELFDTVEGGDIYIAAAGPSLGEQFDLIRTAQAEGGFLIAVDAALKPLAREEIWPDLVISIDEVRDHLLALFDLDLTPLTQTPLVYFPCVHGDVLARWPGPRFGAYSHSEVFDGMARTLPRGRLYASGSVLHSAVDLAVRMGARRLHLLGADFAYPGGHSHVRGAVFDQDVAMLDPGDWVINGHGERVVTTRNLRGYLRDLEHYIEQHPEVLFINHSREGGRIAGACYRDEIEL